MRRVKTMLRFFLQTSTHQFFDRRRNAYAAILEVRNVVLKNRMHRLDD